MKRNRQTKRQYVTLRTEDLVAYLIAKGYPVADNATVTWYPTCVVVAWNPGDVVWSEENGLILGKPDYEIRTAR